MHHRLAFRAMGGEMLAILDQDSDIPPARLAKIPEWFETWEQCLSRFRSDSELSRLNRTFDEPVKVSPTLWEVLGLAREAQRQSGGLLTPTVLDALAETGYDRDFAEMEGDRLGGQSDSEGRPVPELSVVLFDDEARTVCLHPDVHLDLGGVAKGWAAHQAMTRLHETGPALVDAAGDISISGPTLDGSPWVIGVADPFQPGRDILNLEVYECGVATSGRDRRRWKQGGRWRHHIIDPRSGQPAQTDLLTATVVAPTVMEAEAAAKTALLLGSRAGMDWIEGGSSLAGLLVLEDGTGLLSTRMRELVQ